MGQGSIQKLSMMNPGTPQPIATMQTSPHGISTDGQNVYWSNAAMAGTINKVSTMGGQVTTLATNQTWPDCTAVDSKSVYWINTGGSMVSKTAK
jgi:sugar lactone lactonase YvrE